MILKKCYIHNFGKLCNMEVNFNSDKNIFCEENGWGKSTLAAFIRVMFFGFENETKRAGYEKERLKYKPWQGGIYGGNIEFTAGNKEYILYRTFGSKNNKDDEFLLKDKYSGVNSNDFSENIGEELFGIDSNSFFKSIFISQNNCQTQLTDKINGKLGNIVNNTDDINNYEEVDKKLKDKINELSPGRKTGKLSKIKAEITNTEAAIIKLTGFQKEADELKNKLKSDINYKSELLEKIKAFEEEESEISLYKDIQLKYERYENLCNTYEKMTKQLEKSREIFEESQEDYKYKSENKSGNNPKGFTQVMWTLIFLALVTILALLFIMDKDNLPLTIAISGSILAAFFQILIAKKKQKKYIIDNQRPNRNNKAEKMYEYHKEQWENAKYEKEEFEKNNDMRAFDFKFTDNGFNNQSMEEINSKIRGLRKEVDLINEKIKENEIKIREYQKEYDNIFEYQIKLEALKRDYDIGMEKFNDLSEVRNMLMEAKNNFTGRYMTPVSRGLKKYSKIMLNNSEEVFFVNGEGDIFVDEGGMPRDSKLLSCGYKDLAGICMRMAMIDAMYTGEKPFLIFDEPFVNLDEQKIRGAIDFMEEISKEYQIIYFTCHESRT